MLVFSELIVEEWRLTFWIYAGVCTEEIACEDQRQGIYQIKTTRSFP